MRIVGRRRSDKGREFDALRHLSIARIASGIHVLVPSLLAKDKTNKCPGY